MKSVVLSLLFLTILVGLGVSAPPAAAFDPCGTAHCTVWQPGACVGQNNGPCDADDVACVTNAGQPLVCAEFTCACRPVESPAWNQLWICTQGNAPCQGIELVCVGNGAKKIECVYGCACMPASFGVDTRVLLP